MSFFLLFAKPFPYFESSSRFHAKNPQRMKQASEGYLREKEKVTEKRKKRKRKVKTRVRKKAMTIKYELGYFSESMTTYGQHGGQHNGRTWPFQDAASQSKGEREPTDALTIVQIN